MENTKEKFLSKYPDVPAPLRKEIIAVVDGKTYTWDTIYLEVKNNTKLAQKLLNSLKEVGII